MNEVVVAIQECARCKEKIYIADKRKIKGPLRGGKFYCETCWTCYECGQKIKEVDQFSTNPVDKEDLEIYCIQHNTKFATRTKEPRYATPPLVEPKSASDKKSSRQESARKSDPIAFTKEAAPQPKESEPAKVDPADSIEADDDTFCNCNNKKCCIA